MISKMLKCFFMLVLLFALYLIPSKTYAKTFEVSEECFQAQLHECLENSSGKIHIVSIEGNGDFTSIQEAINQSDDKDIIVISPGTYEEYLRIKDKELFFIGVDLEKCIIKKYADTYQNAVVNIGKGRLYNLTIYAYADSKDKQRESVIDITKVAESFGNEELKNELHAKALGYAIHADQEDMINSELVIKNCRIISDANQCLGIGVRSGNKVIIDNCKIVSSGQGGCIYYHNTKYPFKAKQSEFTISNSEIVNMMSPYFMSIHSLTDNHPVELHFKNNVIKAIALDTKDNYNEVNVYTGEAIDSLLVHDKYGLVKVYNLKESKKYLHRLLKNDNTLDFEDGLVAGINYLITDMEKNIAENINKKAVIIEIFNFDGRVGSGWMGLENFTLATDSDGNTLPEMNYYFVNEK